MNASTSAAQFLRKAQRQHPADFWANVRLGYLLRRVTPRERNEEVRFLTAAVALRRRARRPIQCWAMRSEEGPVGRGHRLLQEGHGARPEGHNGPQQHGPYVAGQGPVRRRHRQLQKGHRAQPERSRPTTTWAPLKDKGQFDAAIDCYKKAIELDPN